jgi:hypothetical protein
MRYVSSIPAVATGSSATQVRALSSVPAIKPVHTPEQVIPFAAVITAHLGTSEPPVELYQKRNVYAVDKRKICRRVSHQAVLIELRSGIDRRRRNLLKGAVVEHIDETV